MNALTLNTSHSHSPLTLTTQTQHSHSTLSTHAQYSHSHAPFAPNTQHSYSTLRLRLESSHSTLNTHTQHRAQQSHATLKAQCSTVTCPFAQQGALLCWPKRASCRVSFDCTGCNCYSLCAVRELQLEHSTPCILHVTVMVYKQDGGVAVEML